MIAVAIYASRAPAPAPVATLAAPPKPVPQPVAVPVAPSEGPAPRPVTPTPVTTIVAPGVAGTAPLAPEQTFTLAAFSTQWFNHAGEGAQRCKGSDGDKPPAGTKDFEIPLTLTIAADGHIEDATPAGASHTYAMDGTLRPGFGGESLARCYAAAVKDLVRFPPATAGGKLSVEARVTGPW
jgi:hypothetical protein